MNQNNIAAIIGQHITKPWAIQEVILRSLAVQDLKSYTQTKESKPEGLKIISGTAILPLYGMMVSNAPEWAKLFGVISPQAFASKVKQASRSAEVKELISQYLAAVARLRVRRKLRKP